MLARLRPTFLLIGLVLILIGAPLLEAQIHGVPASVTSFGFGGNFSSTPGVAASVTSLGPNGFGNSPVIFGNCCFDTFRFKSQPPIFFHRHRGHNRGFFPVAVPVYSAPYMIDQPDVAEYDEENYQGGPTVFDRRGSGAILPRERVVEPEPAPSPAAAAAPLESVVAQPSTVLVFKDGHQTEVQNYAIVGDTLFDLAEHRSHKILLADLDLPATRKANDERGVDFQVPVAATR
jgi:hypothetical protein